MTDRIEISTSTHAHSKIHSNAGDIESVVWLLSDYKRVVGDGLANKESST